MNGYSFGDCKWLTYFKIFSLRRLNRMINRTKVNKPKQRATVESQNVTYILNIEYHFSLRLIVVLQKKIKLSWFQCVSSDFKHRLQNSEFTELAQSYRWQKKIELNEWTIRMLLMAKTCLVFIVGRFFRGFASFWTMAAEILI